MPEETNDLSGLVRDITESVCTPAHHKELDKLEQRFDLTPLTVGVLGMAFKAESDDPRSSLSYKMKRILIGKAGRVLCSDPYVTGVSSGAALGATFGIVR